MIVKKKTKLTELQPCIRKQFLARVKAVNQDQIGRKPGPVLRMFSADFVTSIS